MIARFWLLRAQLRCLELRGLKAEPPRWLSQAAATVLSEAGEEAGLAAPPGAKPAGVSLVEGVPAQALDFVLEVQFLTLEFGDAQVVAGEGLHRVVKLALEGFVLGGELAQMRLQGHEVSLLSQFPTGVDWHRMEHVSKPFGGKVDGSVTGQFQIFWSGTAH
jgi:hypothetical protein